MILLGIDYGRARIGLALADTVTGLPKPLDTLQRVNRNEDMRRLRELARAHDVKEIIVGLPLRLDGTSGEMAEEATRFAARIRKQIGLPVHLVDERLTSWEAERLLEEQAGRKFHDESERASKKPKLPAARPGVDSIAAAVILRDYLEQARTAKHLI